MVYTENLEAQAATAGATFDPFAILGIDAGASKAEAKKAYHRLSLLYHPDRPETGDPRLFMRISKAYAALTDDTARRNWEEFGNPDGPGATSFGIALPAWIVAEENSLLVLLVYVAALLIGLPLVVRFWWANSSKYGGFKVLLDTTQLFFFYIHRTPAGMNPARVLKVLSGAFEFDPVSNGGEVAVRESDNWLLPRLIKALVTNSGGGGAAPSGSALTQAENNGPNRDTPLCYPYAVKARALLYAHLYRVPLPVESSASSPNSSSSPLEADQQYLLSKCPYLLQEFVQCAAQLTGLAANGHVSHSPTLETLEAAMKLSAALVQAVPPTGKSPLLQVPHLSEHDLRFLSSRKRGRIGGLAALARLGADFGEEGEAERRAMLRRLDDCQYGDVVAFLRHLPLLTVEVKAEVLDDGEQGGRVTAGALVTTTVTLTRKDMPATVEDLEGEVDGGDALKTTTTTAAKSAQEEAEKEKETAKPAKPVWNRKPAPGGGGKKNAKGRKGGGGGRQNLNQNRRRQLDFVMPKLEEISEDEADGKEEKVRSNGGDGWKIAEEKEDDSWEEKEKKGKKEENGSKKKESSSSKTSSSELFEAPSRRSHPVHCPLFPTAKQEHWWIYLTDRGGSAASQQQNQAHLVTLPFFMTNLVERESVELKFTAPASPGTYAYTVHVRSDSYVELDYSAPLKLRVYDAPEPVTEHPQWADVSDSEEEEEEDGEDSSSGEEYSGSSDSSDGSDSDDEESNSSDSEETEEKSSTVESSSTGASNSFSKECDSGESFEL